jgi:hypothetical protein
MKRGRWPTRDRETVRTRRFLPHEAPDMFILSRYCDHFVDANATGTAFEVMERAARQPASIPPRGAEVFRATVHGIAFAGRARHLKDVRTRQELVLIPDPPGLESDHVWVHLQTGDPVGHLPEEIGSWLAPWMRRGGTARSRVLRVGDETVPSWKRLLVEVTCSGR